MPLGQRVGDKSDSRYCGVETAFSDDVPETLRDNLGNGFDFVLMTLTDPKYRPSQTEEDLNGPCVPPFAGSDLVLCPAQWNSHVVGKVSSWIDLDSDDEVLRMDSETVLKQEIAWAAHLSLQACLLPTPQGSFCANYARCVNQILQGLNNMQLWLRIPLVSPEIEDSEHTPDSSDTFLKSDSVCRKRQNKDSWEWWNTFRLLCEHHSQLSIALDILSSLPSANSVGRWSGEPVRAAIVHTDAFLTNARGYPCLSKRHQKLVTTCFNYSIQIVISGAPLHHVSGRSVESPEENNNHGGTIPEDIGVLSKLEVLLLYTNGLSGGIPPALSHCKSLVRLDLSDNQLTGYIPAELGSLPSLKILHLHVNKLTGRIPPSLGRCSNLTTLALYNNQLAGPIPQSLGLLSRLEKLTIFSNQLSGSIPPSLFNCSSLVNISVPNNQLTGQIPPEIGKLSMLNFLSLGNNLLSGEVPATLYNCSLLRKLDISRNNFSGSMKGISELKKLELLSLHHNSYTGTVPIELGSLRNLYSLDLGSNRFSGPFPPSLGVLTHLQRLFLDRNYLTGRIPNEITGCRELAELKLDWNQFSGTIPEAISNLEWLNLLSLSGNLLSGPIPESLRKCIRLQNLDISYNKLTGSIPRSVASLRGLQINFNLSNNLLSGSIPSELGGMQMVQFVDLSNNNLSGAIPSSIAGCVGLQGLDLSGNTLQGQIPVALSRLQNLEQFLNLSNNHLQGEIPAELGELKLLRSLDLSSNMLSGKIPVELGNLTSLRTLNLSGNELEGPVPPVGILKSFNSSSFGVLHSRHRRRHTITVVVISVIVSAIISLLFCIAFILCYRGRRKNNINSEGLSISMPGEPLIQRFTKRDLEMATESFSAGNIIGSSTISTVYRGVLRNGKVVAVKTLKMENSKELDQCFKRELYTMARIRHRNLVKVVGYAWDNRLKALVMELMPNGNLDAVLHSVDAGEGLSAQLDLSKRLSICISIAQALVYLHENYDFPIVHCDLKPANILLDEDFEAHVSDFGTARMLGIHLQQEASQGTLSAFQLGTIGYVAPEFAYMARVTPSADVFSFGIILMELLTRKRPTRCVPSSSSASDQKGNSLPEWIENVFKDCKSLISVIDPLLLQNVSEEQEGKMTSLLKISLLCTKSTPENRPSMNQVLPWLLKIKENRIHDEDIY